MCQFSFWFEIIESDPHYTLKQWCHKNPCRSQNFKDRNILWQRPVFWYNLLSDDTKQPTVNMHFYIFFNQVVKLKWYGIPQNDYCYAPTSTRQSNGSNIWLTQCSIYTFLVEHWFFKIKFEPSSGHSSYHIGAQQNIDLLGVKWRVLCKIFKGEIYFLKSQKSEIVFICIIGRVLLGRAFVFQIKRS